MGNYNLSRMFNYILNGLQNPELANKFGLTGSTYKLLGLSTGYIGKLSIKEEAAGKARVFAMVDCWTQSALYPLHQMIFSLLKQLPNDATFNQEASVVRCQEKSLQFKKSFGYDLSAATDRLPIILQMKIINTWVPGLGDLWKSLLVDRLYALTIKAKGKEPVVKELEYAVGQPMGALSSWAMLAVTHHAIAQLAARRAAAANPDKVFISTILSINWSNFKWYTGYEVLGDDIVFFEDEVAAQYLILMEKIGVPINLMKSVIAKNATFEFAKVLGHNGVHVAAISWAMFMAQPTLMGRAQIGYALLSKGVIKSRPIAVLTRLARISKHTVGSVNPFFLALGTMFSQKGRIDWIGFLYAIMQKSLGYINIYQTLLDTSNITNIQRAIAETIKTGEPATVPNPLEKRRGWKTDIFALKQSQVTVIENTFNKLHPYRDAAALAMEILCAPSMLLSINQERRDLFISKGVFTWDKTRFSGFNPEEKFMHHLFLILSCAIYDKLVELYSEVAFNRGDLIGKEISELFSLIDTLDRYREVLLLFQRALDKLANKAMPDRNLIESPLSALQFLLEMDDPYGPTPSDWQPDYDGSLVAMQYMYVLERLENLPCTPDNVVILGERDRMKDYLSTFGP